MTVSIWALEKTVSRCTTIKAGKGDRFDRYLRNGMHASGHLSIWLQMGEPPMHHVVRAA